MERLAKYFIEIDSFKELKSVIYLSKEKLLFQYCETTDVLFIRNSLLETVVNDFSVTIKEAKVMLSEYINKCYNICASTVISNDRYNNELMETFYIKFIKYDRENC